MLVVVSMIIGASIGAVLDGVTGMALGAGFGFMLGGMLDTRKRLERLEREVLEMRSRSRETADEPLHESEHYPKEEPSSLNYNAFTEAAAKEIFFEIPPGADKTEKSFPGPEKTVENMDEPSVNGTDQEPYAGFTKLFRFITPLRENLERFLSGGNLLVKTGIVILFVGVSFLLKYASEHRLLPIEVRLASAVLAGIGLLALGWRLRAKREGYALVLQGGGVGVLYISIFAALRLYNLIPAFPALAMMVAIATLSAALALFQDARSLAVLGASGGFLAPVLASTGEGSHVMLFSFYGILNAGILAIAWFKAWRSLNLVGFIFTFVLGSLWGFRYYGSSYFETTEPFLILFFLFYVAVAVLFAFRQPPQLRGYVDTTLVFGTPLIAFGLQSLLVQSAKHGIAFSALGLALFYTGLSRALFLKKAAGMKTLAEAFLAIGIVFITLTIPLTLENRWTAAFWALEGAAMVWIGTKQNRLAARIFGMVLQLLSGAVLMKTSPALAEELPALNGFYLGCLIVCFSALFSTYYLYLNRQRIRPREQSAAAAMAVWGLLWWFGSGLAEIEGHSGPNFRMGLEIAFIALSCLACDFFERRLEWPFLRFPALGLLPALFFMALELSVRDAHPFMQLGFAAWPLAFAAYYRILYKHEALEKDLLRTLHAGAFWLLAWIASRELGWQLSHMAAQAHTWLLIGRGLAPALLLFAASGLERKLPWPLEKHREAYLGPILGVVAAYLWCWSLHINLTDSGDSLRLSYIPFLSPLDLAIGFAYASLAVWFLKLRAVEPEAGCLLPVGIVQCSIKLLPALYALTVFFWLNAILVRTVHFWAGVGFGWKPMIGSVVFETSISVFWSLSALFIMVLSTRRSLRRLWLSGALLLGVVVLKLFLIDLSNTGTVSRIISFIVVGILLLVVGYFSPVPPRREARPQ